MSKPNILFFDIETTPLRGYTWQAYDSNLISIEQDAGLLSIAYKINKGKTEVCSRRLFTERQLVQKLWKLFDDADIIVAQNGDKFDIRMANMFFVKYGLNPPSPYKTVDTLKLARRYFRFGSNKLDYLSQFLLKERKIQTNITLWVECMNGDESALVQMERYNKHDVDLLYRVYNKIRMWHTGHPNHNVYTGTTHKCPTCGSNTQKRGYMYTRVGTYQRYQCTSCAAWSKGERIIREKPIS
jgi:uncharacterized protein YprB with RNaseH-like and TPR domain/predicted RNA-binding Zn-ribbon protein involved in translation (DUF1610 family)